MSIILQILVVALIVYSFVLIVAVPITLSTASGWSKSKSSIVTASIGWVGMVLLTGVLNSFVS
jgi:photosystem II PsbZ protein|uniref:Photosystem II reaction center protein Z n=2 Tax=Cyanidioschyzon merolae TaxID=45157 RepID=PSBZ_CYAM1|nr:Ycf9 [Cyanidioschyzon merolae strain 10D]Q85FY1.1 RecName: Full=Photosystem II reaction center protein Z; Short=PSII-Z [Cyanidioschyzon merolae strain 10D]4YUU_Z2 Chain Z2, Photosystem II reaction center protein Z [Cyanidium caldarium]4YUU_z2 Chain z2, Photosystem II reaction center protein Z [Cyanidium caldarium]QFV17003.1 photosystem II protein Y [Cyanidioschyzon merolae]QFV17179.1 photosystem II protein Y [Cyanidioschyzon merolae]BAC76212.1 photosystem II protein Y [Cyanidioschyzon mero